jgi:hypothetical protein
MLAGGFESNPALAGASSSVLETTAPFEIGHFSNETAS